MGEGVQILPPLRPVRRCLHAFAFDGVANLSAPQRDGICEFGMACIDVLFGFANEIREMKSKTLFNCSIWATARSVMSSSASPCDHSGYAHCYWFKCNPVKLIDQSLTRTVNETTLYQRFFLRLRCASRRPWPPK